MAMALRSVGCKRKKTKHEKAQLSWLQIVKQFKRQRGVGTAQSWQRQSKREKGAAQLRWLQRSSLNAKVVWHSLRY